MHRTSFRPALTPVRSACVRWVTGVWLCTMLAVSPIPSARAEDASRDHPVQAEHGRVETVTLANNHLGTPKSFKVYLPPGYPAHGPYPTLYLLRGTMDEWLNPAQDDSRKGRTAISLYEDLRRAGKVGDMILVFPSLADDAGQRFAVMINWATGTTDPGVGCGAFADYFFDDLIPAVDARYRTLATGKHRAIDGFSLGGWAAVQAAVSHPSSFGSVGSFDGTIPIASSRDQVDSADPIWQEPNFDPVFGHPRQWDRLKAASPANLIWQSPDTSWQDLQWLLHRCPPGTPDSDERYARAFETVLEAHGGINRVTSVLPGGHHCWWYADEHLAITLPLHWQRIH